MTPALALILALLAGGASVATIAGAGSQAVINIHQIENGDRLMMPAQQHMTPLGADNPSFDGK